MTWYDKRDDILNIQLKEGEYWKSIEVSDNVIIDIDSNGSIISIEILGASKVFSSDTKKVLEAAN